MGRWEKCGERGKTGSTDAGGFISSFLKGAQERAVLGPGRKQRPGEVLLLAGLLAESPPNPLLRMGQEGGPLAGIHMSIFYFCLKA